MARLFYPNLVERLASVRSAATGLASVWLPPRCLHCGAVIPVGVLCVGCAVLLEDSRLMPCDLPLSVGPFPLATRWMFSDASPVRSLHHAFKYEGRTDVGPAMARPLAGVVRGLWGALASDSLLPPGVKPVCTGVPSHRLRVLERGYCQAHLLATFLAAELDVPLSGRLLERREHTRSQTALSAAERRQNVAKAFRPVEPGVASIPPAIILVDDVVTTGATLLGCAEVLRSAGCRFVLLAAPGVRPPLPLGGHFELT